MTTIAYRDGVLAADKKASHSGTAYRTTKLWRTKTHAMAVAGDLSVGIRFVEWFKNGQKGKCPLNSSTQMLVMDLESGKCWHWESPGIAMLIEDRFAALGSGSDLAIGAMSYGASAIEAVICASEWDNESGLGVNFARSRKARRKLESERRALQAPEA